MSSPSSSSLVMSSVPSRTTSHRPPFLALGSCLLSLILALTTSSSGSAFSVLQTIHLQSHRPRILPVVPFSTKIAMKPSEFSEMNELEEVRAALEDVIRQYYTGTTTTAKPKDSAAVVQQPVLTETGRHRRHLELGLLQNLADSDEAIDELVHMWMYETGDARAAERLHAMQDLCFTGLRDEIDELNALVHEYPAWAEAKARLALVYYYKGRVLDAEHMALQAVQCKPWHFEAVQLLIMLALRQQDMGKALQWARHYGLPNLRLVSSPVFDESTVSVSAPVGVYHKRRAMWVAWAATQAQKQWEQAEWVTAEMYRESSLESSMNEQVWQ